MKALAIDSSPKKKGRNTAMLLDPYLEGMREAGAEVELYYGEDLVIYPCCGNLNCTVRTPGRCMAHDDMRWLRKKIGRADILILASPLYFNGTIGPEGVTVPMRSLLDRLATIQSSSSEVWYEHAVHTTREDVSLRKVVLVSGYGFWEFEGLYPILTHLKAFCQNTYPGFEGNILECRGASLKRGLKCGTSREDVIQVAREAGRRLVREDKPPSMMGRLSGLPRDIVSHTKREWENVILYQF
jgi:hypothetical protein